jgi:GntR family transcriptional regulator
MARPANVKLVAAGDALTNDSRVPLYTQIFLNLRRKIVDGEYADGAFLPSEIELASAFAVSRITAKRALNELAEAGFAVRHRGRGTRVRRRGLGTMVSGSVQSLIDSLRANSRNHPRVLSFDYVPAPPEAATALNVGAGTIVQRAQRIGNMDGVAYSHLTTYVPEAIGRTWTASDLEAFPLVALLERAGAAVEVAEQAVSATQADNELADALDVAVGAPLLRVERTSFAADERPVEHLVACYRSDRYQFLMTLTRDPDTGDWS